MGYFANSTESEMFKDDNCYQCLNWRDLEDGRGFGCPIIDLHQMYNYELCNSKSKAKQMLDFFIPEFDYKRSIQPPCSMFLKDKSI